jgi:ATP phosphoribosyltransferase
MVEYDIDAENLEKACEITPGIEAPTVSPLNKKGWYAVKAMTRKKMINSIMDDLSDAGARGILVSDIRTCRI